MREKEKQAPQRAGEPEAVLDPRILESWLEPKADADWATQVSLILAILED